MKTTRRSNSTKITRRKMGGVKCDSCAKDFRKLKDYEGEQFCAWCHKEVLKRVKDASKIEDIQLFKTAGEGRGNNDDSNKKRENVLQKLYNPPVEYLADPYWAEMSTKWKEFLHTLCDKPYDTVNFKKMAGRGYNYDMEIVFLKEKAAACTVKAEFKHNANKIDKLPEYFSPAADKPYFANTYGEFFYDNYIDTMCGLTEKASALKPSKPDYTKHLYQADYKKNPLFECLYGEEALSNEFKKRKKAVVDDSINKYLMEYLPTLNKKLLSDDIRSRQSGKVFILWDLKNFQKDSLSDDEMEIVSATEIKNKNTILAVSKSGTIHEMLLRWKNHAGILYPAFQIKLRRPR